MRIMLGSAGVGLILLAVNVGSRAGPAGFIVGSVALLVLLALLLFESLTVGVTRDRLEVRFGPGLIRKSFRIADILEAHAIRNRWCYGWGIRLTPHGWLFNVSGRARVKGRLEDAGASGRVC